MSLQGSLTGVRNSIVATLDGFTADNCSIGDEAIFNYIQTNPNAPEKGCIVEYNGLDGKSRTEFRSVTVGWKILVNAFFMIKDYDYVSPMDDARDFVDLFIGMCAANPTLDGSVMIARIQTGSEPLEYKRGNFAYVLISLELEVMDNIS